MWFIWISALKDLRRRMRDPAALAVWVLMPMIVTLIVTLVFGNGDVKPRGTLLVLDRDGSFISGMFSTLFHRQELNQTVTVEKARDLASARKRIDAGKASALLIIPEGFGSAVLGGRPTRLSLLTNPSQRILPGIIREVLSTAVDASFYGTKLFSSRHLIELDSHVEDAKPFPPIGPLFFTGMLFLSVLLVSQGLAADVWRERSFGTLRRIATAPQHLELFLVGKLLAIGLILVVVTGAGLASGHFLLHLSVPNPALAIAWMVCFGLSFNVLMTAIEVHATNDRAGHMFTTFLVFLLGMLGGTFFPFEWMPDWLAAIGKWTPNGWAILRFKAILAGAIDPWGQAAAFAVLIAMGTGALLILTRRVRRSFLL
jgi:ABC-2 type transport system permease protein